MIDDNNSGQGNNKILHLGDTIGEEIIFVQKSVVYRMESCLAS